MRRLVGVDVTRGLAVLGMFTAHVGDVDEDLWSPTGWLQVTDGRSAATFAMLAGLSAALLSGGPTPPADLGQARRRIAARAVLIGLLGLVLEALGTPIAVILPGYAVMFVLLVPVLGLAPRTLVALAAVVLAVGPPVLVTVRRAVDTTGAAVPFPLDLLVGDYYPAVVWIAYLLVGLAVGRCDLRAAAVRWRLVAAGLACAVAGYGVGAARRALTDDVTLRALLDPSPHSDMATEVVGNVGVALLVLVAALALADAAPRVVVPLAATGALALSAYTGHLLVIAALGEGVVRDPDNTTLAAFVLVTVAACTAWRLTLGRGPLEHLLHGASTAAARPTARTPVPG